MVQSITYSSADLAHLLELGGALIDPATHGSPNQKMIGSWIVYEAESIEAVRKLVEEDVYWTGNVVSNRFTAALLCCIRLID